ncbi:MAG: rhamnogalacturonan acetylesterase [Lachnospiraceae bacterium]|nr:rhamnogalacturonan acetylesterase [Lachnospiraceae bacterium]
MLRKIVIKIGATVLCAVTVLTIMTAGKAEEVKAEENVMTYEYGDDGIVDGSLELKTDAVAGKNYTVTIVFTGTEEGKTTLNIGYDRVTDDQIVPNVNGGSDRSGLLGETVKAGEEQKRSFNVAAIEDGITFKFNGKGKIVSITLKELTVNTENHKTTIYTIGDSLVQTYTDKYAPQTGWGQMLQEYFNSDTVQCVNHAIGGRSTGNFIRQGRFNEVLTKLCPGDYVFIQFGHNDATVGNEDRYVSVEDYKKNLADHYIKAIEQRGATAVLVTLANRNDYNAKTGVFNVSFSNYVTAMREVAAETDTKLIDLNAKTVEKFTELNKEYGVGITEAIIYNHAIAGAYAGDYVAGVADNTHLQKYGAYLVAGMVAEGVKELELPVISDGCVIPVPPTKVPDAPTGIETRKYLGSISRIKWKAVEGADFYKVYVADVREGVIDGEYELAGYTTVCDFAYDDAALKHDYAYKVVAINAAGESEESEVFIFESEIETTKKKVNNMTVASEESGIDIAKVLPIVGIAVAVIAVIGVVVAVVVMKKKK